MHPYGPPEGYECRVSRLGASFIQDAHNGFCVLVGFFVERASDLRHWQPIRLWPVDQWAAVAGVEKAHPTNPQKRSDAPLPSALALLRLHWVRVSVPRKYPRPFPYTGLRAGMFGPEISPGQIFEALAKRE
jgi:hypothetical protein